jgi:hypothetical protein
MLRLRRGVEEVPGLQLPFLALDDQKTLPRQDEEGFLPALPVVHRHRLTRLENVEVDSKLRKAALALEVAERAEPPGVAPTNLPCAYDEPALSARPQAVFRHLERRFGNHRPYTDTRAEIAARREQAPPA